MPQRVTGTLKIIAQFLKYGLDAPTQYPIAHNYEKKSTFGYKGDPGFTGGIDDIDDLWQGIIPLVGATDVLDLRSLVNSDGGAASFAIVRGGVLQLISNDNTHSVLIEPDPTDGWTNVPTLGHRIKAGLSDANVGVFSFPAPNTTGYPTATNNRRWRLNPGVATLNVAALFWGVKV